MTMHKQHPQRCLHSHVCKWNKDNYQDCIDTDCASHRYTYNTPAPTEQEIHRNFMVRCRQFKTVAPNKVYLDGRYHFASAWLSQQHPNGYDVDYFSTVDDAKSAITRCEKENPDKQDYWKEYRIYQLVLVHREFTSGMDLEQAELHTPTPEAHR